MPRKLASDGSSIAIILVSILAVAIVGFSGWYVWHSKHDIKTVQSTIKNSSQTKSITTKPKQSNQTANPYAGWQTYCDTNTTACVRYPAGWGPVANSSGDFENSTNTGYIALGSNTNKDEGASNAYIYSVTNLPATSTPLDVVGYVVNNQPSYEMFSASYITSAGITAGSMQELSNINYAFQGPSGMISLVATPGADGYAAIKNSEEAKAWFDTSTGQTSLKAMESFYYE